MLGTGLPGGITNEFRKFCEHKSAHTTHAYLHDIFAAHRVLTGVYILVSDQAAPCENVRWTISVFDIYGSFCVMESTVDRSFYIQIGFCIEGNVGGS